MQHHYFKNGKPMNVHVRETLKEGTDYIFTKEFREKIKKALDKSKDHSDHLPDTSAGIIDEKDKYDKFMLTINRTDTNENFFSQEFSLHFYMIEILRN
jgi:hypothetical protein